MIEYLDEARSWKCFVPDFDSYFSRKAGKVVESFCLSGHRF